MTSPIPWQIIPAFVATLGIAMADGFLPSHSQPPPIKPLVLAERNLRVDFISGTPTQAGWRLRGEKSWRISGALSPRLYQGEHWVEFRPVPGWVAPAPALAEITVSGASLSPNPAYTSTSSPTGTGFLRATHSPAVGGWRVVGSGASWTPSGSLMPNLPPGPANIEFQPVSGYRTPPSQALEVFPGQGTATRATYHPVPANSTWAFSPLSPDSTNARHISKAPFCYLGKIDSPFGTFTGVAVAQYTVLTTLRAVYDFEKDEINPNPNPNLTWSWAHDASFGINEPLTPAGFVFPVDWNSESLRNPENQIIAIYFRTPVANGGHSGHHPYLEAGRNALFAGYQVTAGNPIAVSTAEVPLPSLVFSNTNPSLFPVPNLHLADGLVGAPLLTRRSDNRWYPAAMHLGNSQFRRIDSSIEGLIRVAEEAALRGKGGTFSEGKRLGSQFGIDSPRKGIIRTQITGPSSGQWGLVGQNPNNLSGTELEVDVGQREVQFTIVDGYRTPEEVAVTVTEGTTAELMVAYLSLVSSWDSTVFSAVQKALGNTGPLDDFDRDGINNLLEWAFGFNPTMPDLWQQGSGPLGMPVIETKPEGGDKRLEVRFIRRKNAGAMGVHYEAQFSSELHQNWRAVAPILSDVKSINADWECVTVSDRDAPPNAIQRFARVAVREVAPP